MARTKFASPTLQLRITGEQYERAIQSASGGCLIADAIKSQYPEYTGVTVDMATIRFTDRKAGLRYAYLTPPVAQHALLAFDQGWPQSTDEVIVKRAVKITPVIRSNGRTARGAARKAELEQKVRNGEDLTRREKASLTRLQKMPSARPAAMGPSEVKDDGKGVGAVVYGGTPLPQGKPHPNLLRSRNRHFGAKLADPGQAFNEAVEAAVADRLRQGTE